MTVGYNSHGILWKAIHPAVVFPLFQIQKANCSLGSDVFLKPQPKICIKLCLVPGTSLGHNLKRISRQNRKKMLVRISSGFAHVSGGPATGQIPSPCPCWAGWREVQGSVAGERESPLFVQTWTHDFRNGSPLVTN